MFIIVVPFFLKLGENLQVFLEIHFIGLVAIRFLRDFHWGIGVLGIGLRRTGALSVPLNRSSKLIPSIGSSSKVGLLSNSCKMVGADHRRRLEDL